MLSLPEVTLVCVDTRTPDLALHAIRRSMDQVAFGDAILYTDPARLRGTPPPGLRVLPVTIRSVPEYSEFMLRGMTGDLHTSHLLVVQWDGYVLDASRWDPEFLAQDYIGALWTDWSGDAAVGNGGFSLRSLKLQRALQDPEVRVRHPEDLCICHDNRALLERRHGIRFAAPEMAARFAYERIRGESATFGFHGLFNMHHVLPPEGLRALIEMLPDSMTLGVDTRDLCRALIREGWFTEAAMLIAKRRRARPWDRRAAHLQLTLLKARLARCFGRHPAGPG